MLPSGKLGPQNQMFVMFNPSNDTSNKDKCRRGGVLGVGTLHNRQDGSGRIERLVLDPSGQGFPSAWAVFPGRGVL